MERKLLLSTSILLLLCVILAQTRTAKAQAPVFAAEPSSQTISQPGIEFSVNITVTNSPPVIQWALNLSWNPNVLNITNPGTDLIEGDFLKRAGSTAFMAKTYNISDGFIPEMSCIIMAVATSSGDGLLCTINFTSIAMGSSDIDIIWGTLTNETGYMYSPTLIDGTVEVIPEFPANMLLPIFLIATTIITLIATTWARKRRDHLHIP